MNRIIKVGIASLALAAAVPSFAQDIESENEGKVGWTPICVGIATPVQIPWGLDRWDVFGIDLNLFYSDAPLMYGLDIGGLAATTRETMIGLQVAGLANIAFADVYGMRATLGLNFCAKSVYGVEAGLVGLRDKIVGMDVEFLGSAQRYMTGLQVGGLANFSAVDSYGMSVAGLANVAKVAHGLHLACLFNYTEDLHGAQIALVNYAYECDFGFQIGLVNIIMSNVIPVLPFVNCCF